MPSHLHASPRMRHQDFYRLRALYCASPEYTTALHRAKVVPSAEPSFTGRSAVHEDLPIGQPVYDIGAIRQPETYDLLHATSQ